MKSIVFISGIFYTTGIFAMQGATAGKNLAKQVTTKVIVNTVGEHSQLFNLVQNGSPVELLAAIFRGADVNATDGEKTLLQHAQQLGQDDMAVILLRHGAEDSDVMPAQEETTKVVLPAMTPAQALADNALKKKCDNTLHLAVLAGQTAKAKGLIAAGSDINGRDELGKTIAHHAAIAGNLEIITTLVENHADMNIKDNFGNTPYAVAKFAEQHDVVAYLTPMMDAAILEEAELADLQAAALALREQNKTCRNRAF